MSRIENVVRVALAFKDAFNQRDIPGMMELITPECEYENPQAPNGQKYTGKEDIEQYWREYFNQKPAIQMTGEEVNGLGIRCILRWRLEWQEPDADIKSIRGVDIFEF
jgi:ketosteroid isomerase-like protein